MTERDSYAIHGGCHCGNIRFVLNWPASATEIPARRCGCTFCVKHGGRWTSDREASLAATIRDRLDVSAYRFGTETADFHLCKRCGVPCFVTSDIDGHRYAVVNVNTLDDIDPRLSLDESPSDFDGERTDSRLDRRRRNWIPAVSGI